MKDVWSLGLAVWCVLGVACVSGAETRNLSSTDWANNQSILDEIKADRMPEGQGVTLRGYVYARSAGAIRLLTNPSRPESFTRGPFSDECIQLIPTADARLAKSGYYEIKGKLRTIKLSPPPGYTADTFNIGNVFVMPLCFPGDKFLVLDSVRPI